MTSHEAVCILNAGKRDAHVEITIFFADREPAGPYTLTVPARRTKHLRFNDLTDPEPVPRATTYASLIESDVPVVVQHTRLDSRQAENALLSTIAFAGEVTPTRIQRTSHAGVGFRPGAGGWSALLSDRGRPPGTSYGCPGGWSRAVTAFGSGVLISALAFELMDEAIRQGGFDSTAIEFLGGAAAFHRRQLGPRPVQVATPAGGPCRRTRSTLPPLRRCSPAHNRSSRRCASVR